MAIKNNPFLTATPEERKAIMQAAEERRNQILQDAIDNRAKESKMSCYIEKESQETVIVLNSDGTCSVDTTISKDITRLINKGWKITQITRNPNNGIAGLVCVGNAKDISILTAK